MRSREYRPQDDGKPDFQGKVAGQQKTFSHPSFFNTVFIAGEDLMKEEAAMKQKEIEDWKKNVIVVNTHFKVNTRQSHSH